jgi:hypothetical protein
MYKFIFITALFFISASCATQRNNEEQQISIQTSPENKQQEIEMIFIAGDEFNHPSFAIWTEDLYGNYIETLYVTEYVAKGEFARGEIEPGKWKNEPGELRRPASLPYWSHKRNIKAPDCLYIPSPETAVPDALSSATPKGNFTLNAFITKAITERFQVLLEINQPWDSNEFWTNSRFKDDNNYQGSLQPALIYAVTVYPNQTGKEYFLNPIGHSHPSGENGELFTDLTTLTTAKDIAHKISVRLK